MDQGKKFIFRPIDKEEREMFAQVTKDTEASYDPLAVKLWPINAGDNSLEYMFVCAKYISGKDNASDINLSMVYIAETTMPTHEFKLGKIVDFVEAGGEDR